MSGRFFATGCGFKPFRPRYRTAVTKLNTLLRVAYTLGAYLILAQSASAQSVLNFAKATVNERLNPGFAVVNPTSTYADVQFTYYGLDGNPVTSGLVNPVRHRVAPRGQISMPARELFAGTRGDGWVQVTSPTTGLTGSYFSGDFSTTLEGTDSASALTSQIVPVVRDDQSSRTELVILNPGAASSSVTVTLFTAEGRQVGNIPSQLIPGHGALRLSSAALNLGAATLSARITSSTPVAASAIIDRGDSLLFVTGQAVDQPGSLRIAPHFITASGFDSALILTNPSASQVTARVTVFTENGSLLTPEAVSSKTFPIPANGSISADIRTITNQPIASTVNGWLRVESANVPLAGVVVLDHSTAVTSVPLQAAALDRMIISQLSETPALSTGLSLVNSSAADALVELSVVRADGATIAQNSFTVPANSKFLDTLVAIVPEATGLVNGYIVLRASIPLYGIGLLGSRNSNAFLAAVAPARVPDAFLQSRFVPPPVVKTVEPGTELQSGTTFRVSLSRPAGDAIFELNGQPVTARQLGPLSPSYEVVLPALEPGSVTLTARSNGVESAPVAFTVLPNDSVPTQTISGAAFYQKIDVTDAGLDLNRPVMVPVRSARVEVLSRSSQSIVAVTQTDERGRFSVPVPFDPNLTVRVISRLRAYDLKVTDNTSQGQLYSISTDVDGRVSRSDVLLADTSRVSGAFNILEVIQRGNDLVKSADPDLALPPVTVFWSTRNWKGTGIINNALGMVGTTYFNVATNTAYIVGDRNDHGTDSDSDEFDDAVIVHEYAHLLASRFSRDDSPGGRHVMGDMLDPRVAWSEGWANFFAAAARNDAIWRDSRGANGVGLLRFDREENVPGNDRPGYWSEASVDTILWDLYDDHVDNADEVQYSFAQIWGAFTDLRTDRFVYLPYFLEHFLTRNPAAADAVRTIVQSRSIEFQPNVRPSVAYPFPTPMTVGTSLTGAVDSYTTKRNNLVTSSHFYAFTTTGGAASIRLDIIGLGAGDNPSANDLDIFLMDENGRVIDRSDNGLNGQSERIALRLSGGTYVVEIRSYYTRAETGGFVYNAGQYRLGVSVQ
jgi:hypothetical protein